MRLTGRGKVVVIAIVLAIGSGAFFGARGLNAIAAPGVVALIAGAIQVWRYDRPEFRRELPAYGQRDTHVAVRLHLTTQTPFLATIDETLDAGLTSENATQHTAISDTTIRYDLHLQSRGDRSVGPLTVTATDALGLLTTTFQYSTRESILVRPQVRPLAGPARDDLVHLFGSVGEERGQFDHLRSYTRGDPLRDIHWKSSAKQAETEFVVKEFSADEGTDIVEIGVEAIDGEGDPMADATASIAVDLLEGGVAVALTTPSGRVEPDSGAAQRERILNHLARADTGTIPAGRRADAAVLIRAEGGDPTVEMDGRTWFFASLAGSPLFDTPSQSSTYTYSSPAEAGAP